MATEKPLKIFPQTTFPMKVKLGATTYTWTVRMPTARELDGLAARFEKFTLLKKQNELQANVKEVLTKIAEIAAITPRDDGAESGEAVLLRIAENYSASPAKAHVDLLNDEAIEPLSFDDWIVSVVTSWAVPDFECTPENVLALIDHWPGLAPDLLPLYIDTAKAVRRGNVKG